MSRPAVSYSRWSRPEKGKGDSLRRQREQFLSFCRTHDLRPLAGFDHPIDRGVSAFRGRNRKDGELGQFLHTVRTDPALKGVVVVVENQDRLSRQKTWEALGIIRELVDAGASVGDCMSGRIYDAGSFDDDIQIMNMVMGAGQANRYAENLSVRVKSARALNREQARGGKIVFKRGPSWVKLSADRSRWETIPERVGIVQLIFGLACQGKGCHAIVGELEARGIESPQGKKRWHPHIVHRIVKGREVLGEYQPKLRPTRSTSRPAGDPIPGYYPAIIDQKTYETANALLTKKLVQRRGRPSVRVNIFAGILKDGETGEPFHMKTRSLRGYAILHTRYASGGPIISYEKTVEAFCLAVKEMDPESLEESDPEVRALTMTLASLDGKLAEIDGRIKDETGPIGYLLDIRRDLTREKEATKDLLREAEAKKRNPVKAAVRNLQAASISDPESFRARLRLAVEGMKMHIFRIRDEAGHPRKAAWIEVIFRRGITRAFAFSYRDVKGFLTVPVTMGGTIKVADGKWEFACEGQLETGGREVDGTGAV
jgi:DNA invertase Pin-like site-specific DNA recombinase